MRSRLLATSGLLVLAVGGLSASQVQAGPVDYGPGVAVLQSWFEAGSRGDRAGASDLVASAKKKARAAIERPRVSLQGPAVVAFAVATPTGAIAYVVQHATDTRGGETTVAQGVSLPVGTAIWFDDQGRVVNRVVDFPVSQAESATSPTDAGLTSGIWTSQTQRHVVLLDTGYPTDIRNGVLGPRYSSRNDLVRISDRRAVDFGAAGFLQITPRPRILPGTAQLALSQPGGLSNLPALLGGPSDWPEHVNEHSRDWFPLDLDFESLESSRPLQIRPFDPAYGGHRATQLAKRWTRERISMRTDLWGSPLQARLPGGTRVLMRNVVWGKAYVALVRFPDGKVVGTRCKTPGPILTASCVLPRRLGRLFTVDEQFSWKKGDHDWVAAKTPRRLSVNYTAIVPPGSTIRVEPDGGKPFVLYR